ncbi:MAG: hypothetical protein ACRYFK_19340 [Janthinobacterium lividum]
MKNTSLLTRLLTAVLVLVVVGMFVKILTDKGQKPASGSLVEAAAAGPVLDGKARAAGPRADQAFNYSPLKPVGGKLRGVVELGASGFNSFIVRTDAHHNWQLNKAEYDNSLIMENMASDEDIRRGLRAYITKMLDYGVAGQDIHFVVSSGALKVLATHRIVAQLVHMRYVVNTMTPAKEAALGLSVAMPPLFGDRAFVVDIGSGGTEISWQQDGKTRSVDTYGSKYYEHGVADDVVGLDAKHKAEQVPAGLRQTCFIMGGVPFEMAKQVRKGKERYTILSAPDFYQFESAKTKSGQVIYQAVAEATGCQKFIFDWDANFTIGYLLALPQ